MISSAKYETIPVWECSFAFNIPLNQKLKINTAYDVRQFDEHICLI